jgi:hypothetical protein
MARPSMLLLAIAAACTVTVCVAHAAEKEADVESTVEATLSPSLSPTVEEADDPEAGRQVEAGRDGRRGDRYPRHDPRAE